MNNSTSNLFKIQSETKIKSESEISKLKNEKLNIEREAEKKVQYFKSIK